MSADIREARRIWEELERRALTDGALEGRLYKRLGLDRESGLRISYKVPEGSREILVHVGEDWKPLDLEVPTWRGMKFKMLELDAPSRGAKHIGFSLTSQDHSQVFEIVCEDLIRCLEDCTDAASRRMELWAFLLRWSEFFKKCDPEGLSSSFQRGLLGEIWWLKLLVDSGMDALGALEAWKGCERAFHDFDFGGRVTEVKTTMTKEPRKVWINNERQLDDRGLGSLHLFVLTLQKQQGGGISLPELINKLRSSLRTGRQASLLLERKLVKAGYLDMHAQNYEATYIRKAEELFCVRNGFPRIIRLPGGAGDLRYSLTLSACTKFTVDLSDFLSNLNGD